MILSAKERIPEKEKHEKPDAHPEVNQHTSKEASVLPQPPMAP